MKKKFKIMCVVGARPNFMKIAPLYRIIKNQVNIDSTIVHTGQHYDEKMSDVFFRQLGLPEPHYHLEIESGSHAVTTAKIMIAFEEVLIKETPDLVVVVGDVNSTIACALVASKLHIKIAHVEAGLRSADLKMPEEVNRILTDHISDFLFVSESSGVINLLKEGINESKIFFVGNIMIDSVIQYKSEFEKRENLSLYGLREREYTVVTLHRPSNVDHLVSLEKLVNLLREASKKTKIIFPIHPRTKKNLEVHNLMRTLSIKNITITPPMGYIEFLSLVRYSAAVLTDSGGIQEETTYLGIPCVTLRNSTERPSTISLGTNVLVSDLDVDGALSALDQIIEKPSTGIIPPLWDGRTAKRISKILMEECIQ